MNMWVNTFYYVTELNTPDAGKASCFEAQTQL